jgi:hypothetical protein
MLQLTDWHTWARFHLSEFMFDMLHDNEASNDTNNDTIVKSNIFVRLATCAPQGGKIPTTG